MLEILYVVGLIPALYLAGVSLARARVRYDGDDFPWLVCGFLALCGAFTWPMAAPFASGLYRYQIKQERIAKALAEAKEQDRLLAEHAETRRKQEERAFEHRLKLARAALPKPKVCTCTNSICPANHGDREPPCDGRCRGTCAYHECRA